MAPPGPATLLVVAFGQFGLLVIYRSIFGPSSAPAAPTTPSEPAAALVCANTGYGPYTLLAGILLGIFAGVGLAVTCVGSFGALVSLGLSFLAGSGFGVAGARTTREPVLDRDVQLVSYGNGGSIDVDSSEEGSSVGPDAW